MSTDPYLKYDSRPLWLHELIEDERQLLDRFVTHLGRIAKEVGEGPERPTHAEPQPWATIDLRRTPRTLMLDGPRGTGKTSLMLTLLRGIDLAHQRGGPSRGEDPQPWRGDPEILRGFRALPITDLHPMPEDLPIYAWLMQGFTGVAELARREPEHAGARSGRCSAAPAQESLSRRLQQLQQAAVVAWNGTRGPKGSSQDEWLLNEATQITEWAQLELHWQAWVSDLLCELERQNHLRAGSVLILPVDDLDLYNRHGRDLLLAIRRLYHPRLVFLLNGDYEHLVEVVARAYLADCESVADQVSCLPQAQVLARALAEKVIPTSMREQIVLPNIKDLLERLEGWRGVFESVPFSGLPELSDPSLNVKTLAEVIALYVAELPDLAARTRFRFRPLMQLMERLRGARPTMAEVVEGLQGALAFPGATGEGGRTFTFRAHTSRLLKATNLHSGYTLHSYVGETLLVFEEMPEGRRLPTDTSTLTLVDLLAEDCCLTAGKGTIRRKTSRFVCRPIDGTLRTLLVVDGFPPMDMPVGPPIEVSTPLERVWLHRATKSIEQIVRGTPDWWDKLVLRSLNLTSMLSADFDDWMSKLPEELQIPVDPLRPAGGAPEDELYDLGAQMGIVRFTTSSQTRFALNVCTPETGLSWHLANLLCEEALKPRTDRFPAIQRVESARRSLVQQALQGKDAPDPKAALEAMRLSEPLHPWHVQPLVIEHGAALWWVTLRVEVPRRGDDDRLGRQLLERNYTMNTCAPAQRRSGTLSDLFYLGTTRGGALQPHTATFAIGAWLLNQLDTSESSEFISFARQVAKSKTREGTGLILRKLFQWIHTAPERLSEQNNGDLRRAALEIRYILVGDLSFEVQPNGEILTLHMSEPPRWVLSGPTPATVWIGSGLAARFGLRSWALQAEKDSGPLPRLAEEGSPPAIWLKTWADAMRAILGVMQSYHCDIHGEPFGDVVGEPTLMLRDETPLPVPPFRAWIDHELLDRQIFAAIRYATGRGDSEESGLLNPGALSRWLLVLYARTCGDLLEGFRGNLVGSEEWRFGLPYPLSSVEPIKRTGSQIAVIAQSSAPEPFRAWATELDRVIRLGLDDEARAAWVEGFEKVKPGSPGAS